ncbi:Cytochrome c domain-containing protein [Thauera humireducens]|uniref:c-type cytochrome n=1 Tax=Thauera humireducens TaxID=1134435 RepID=UPI002467A123|nr:c-type cytochrome [Thauera humireducens]CAH1747739.1 Cytochrome c domain-containing protein [Thauera humireducens]
MSAPKKVRSMFATAALLISFGAAATQPIVDVGRLEYEGACAVCHGSTGKGDGVFASQLVAKVPDLTTLASRNKGVFPFDHVYQTIDGRTEVAAHGSREMPVWGRGFRQQSSMYFSTVPADNTESVARSRILALTEYIYRLQGN